MEQIYSVSQINSFIKSIFLRVPALANITIKGEVSNCTYHRFGHIYFTLKDAGGVMPGVMFNYKDKGLDFKIEDGMSIVVTGAITVYEKQGRYQINANKIVKEGIGQLYEKLEMLKKKLSDEGLFSDVHKKMIPQYAHRIGIVTADSGAAIRDIVDTAHRRNPYVKLVLYPVNVQGEYAPSEIAHGIKVLDTKNLDVIIVGRGGGSYEDLFVFNEEIVCRAIYDCNTPIVSAVGHEIDTTLSDYVADRFAITPTAAAELCVYDFARFCEYMNNSKDRLDNIMNYRIEKEKKHIEYLLARLNTKRPDEILNQKRQYLMDCEDKLDMLMKHLTEMKRYKLFNLADRLNLLSPLNRLSGGYVFVDNEEGVPLKKVSEVSKGDRLNIHLLDGMINTIVEEIKEG